MINKTLITMALMTLLLCAGVIALSNSDFLQLKDNTDECFRQCYTTYTVCNPQSQGIPITQSQDFSFSFIEKMGKLKSTRLKILQNVTTIDRIANPYTITSCSSENGTQVCGTTTYDNFSTKNSQHEEFIPFNPVGHTFNPGTCIDIRIEGSKDFGANIDNILNYAGRTFTEYTWWNATTYYNDFQDNNDINSTRTNATTQTNSVRLNFTGFSDARQAIPGFLCSATSTYSGSYSCNEAMDGDCVSESNAWASSGSSGTEWISFDLNTSKDVAKVVIRQDRSDIYAKDIELFISDTAPSGADAYPDNTYRVYNDSDVGVTGVSCVNQTINITPVKKGRYVTLVINSMNGAYSRRLGDMIVLSPVYNESSVLVSKAISLPVNATKFKLTTNQNTPSGTTIKYNITCDGTTIIPNAPADGTETDCTTGDKLIYTAEMTTANTNTTPTITNITITTNNQTGGSASETDARTAIEQGITDNNFQTTNINTDQYVYFRYVNGTQRYARTDKYFTNGNKKWIFNYLAGSDTTNAISNIGTNIITWENQSLTANQIRQQVRDLINATK